MKTSFFHWVLVGLQGFQLLGFLAQINPRIQASAIPILIISLILITFSAFIDLSKAKNNGSNQPSIFLVAPHIVIALVIFLFFFLGAYLGNN